MLDPFCGCGTAVAAAQKLILSPYQQAERIAHKKAVEQQELFGS